MLKIIATIAATVGLAAVLALAGWTAYLRNELDEARERAEIMRINYKFCTDSCCPTGLPDLSRREYR